MQRLKKRRGVLKACSKAWSKAWPKGEEGVPWRLELQVAESRAREVTGVLVTFS